MSIEEGREALARAARRLRGDDVENCLLCALDAFAHELEGWLDAGGDQLLLEFTPLGSFTAVLNNLAAMQRRGETQHMHRRAKQAGLPVIVVDEVGGKG